MDDLKRVIIENPGDHLLWLALADRYEESGYLDSAESFRKAAKHLVNGWVVVPKDKGHAIYRNSNNTLWVTFVFRETIQEFAIGFPDYDVRMAYYISAY